MFSPKEELLLEEIQSDIGSENDDHFKFFKDSLPQILLGPFLNILSSMLH